MANSLFKNPVKIDTTFTAGTSYKSVTQVAPNTGSGVGSQFTIRIGKIFWLSPANIADSFVITDPVSSLVLWTGVCEVALQSQVFDWTAKPVLWRDFTVLTIASGTLYITLV